MMKQWIGLFFLGFISLQINSHFASAGPDSAFEISAGFSYSKSTYSEKSYTWNRRWGASVGFSLTPLTQLELGYQDSTTRNFIDRYEDTTFRDRLMSLNLVQNLLPKTFPVQPYVKAGVGQLNRDASGYYYAYDSSPTSRVDTVSVILGAGARIYLMNNFAIRTEATSYLAGGYLRKWHDNFALTIGLSLFL